jgi:hypothetical protein
MKIILGRGDLEFNVGSKSLSQSFMIGRGEDFQYVRKERLYSD